MLLPLHLIVSLTLAHLDSKVLADLLLFLSLVLEASNLTLNLVNFIGFLLDKLFDLLQRVVSLLHAKDSLLPVFKEHLLAHFNAFDFMISLFLSVACGRSLLFLGNELGLVESLLLI